MGRKHAAQGHEGDEVEGDQTSKERSELREDRRKLDPKEEPETTNDLKVRENDLDDRLSLFKLLGYHDESTIQGTKPSPCSGVLLSQDEEKIANDDEDNKCDADRDSCSRRARALIAGKGLAGTNSGITK